VYWRIKLVQTNCYKILKVKSGNLIIFGRGEWKILEIIQRSYVVVSNHFLIRLPIMIRYKARECALITETLLHIIITVEAVEAAASF